MDQTLTVQRPHRIDADADASLDPTSGRRRPSALLVVTVALAILIASGITYRATSAAFTASTSTGTNTFTAGSVALTNSSSASALFTVGGLVPGNTGERCVTVDYTGDVNAGIKLYGSATGSLGTHLNLVVQESTTAATPDCTGFTAGTTIITGVMNTVLGTYNNYATGAGTWAVTGAQSRSYRVTYTLPSGASNAAQGTSVNMTLTWEAQSS